VGVIKKWLSRCLEEHTGCSGETKRESFEKSSDLQNFNIDMSYDFRVGDLVCLAIPKGGKPTRWYIRVNKETISVDLTKYILLGLPTLIADVAIHAVYKPF
jgi:hypothetical protein